VDNLSGAECSWASFALVHITLRALSREKYLRHAVQTPTAVTLKNNIDTLSLREAESRRVKSVRLLAKPPPDPCRRVNRKRKARSHHLRKQIKTDALSPGQLLVLRVEH
jgi:hypothetical protein